MTLHQEERNSPKKRATTAELRDLSGIGIDLEGVRRLSKRFSGYLPATSLTELAAEVPVEHAAEAELTVSVVERPSLALRDSPESKSEESLFRAQGWARCQVQQTCARCLKQFATLLEAAFDRLFVPGDDPAESGSQQEMLDELTYLSDSRLEIGHLVEEELLLTLPMIPLCQAECVGLCDGCGADLNQESCRCEETAPDGPFAVLAALKMADPKR